MRTTGTCTATIDIARGPRSGSRRSVAWKRAYCSSLVAVLSLPAHAAAQDLPTMPEPGYFDVVAANPKGTVDNVTYGSNYAARVYTPPGYSENQKYPVMYLMHGMGGSERSWHDNDLYAHIQLDNLIAEGAVDPFILVFTRNDYDSWNFASILIEELIPYVEENYSACADPDNRALGGLSMGGMQTINIGFPNADTFHYLMPSSSAPGIQGENQLFPDDGALARANLKLVFFSCGSGEVGSYGCNNNNTVKGHSEANGLGDIIEEIIIEGGGHDRNTWRPSFWNYAQLAHRAGFTTLASTCGGTGTGGAGGVGGNAGASGSAGMGTGGDGGMGTGGGGAAGANGGTNTGGGSAGTTGGSGGADNGAGGVVAGGAGGSDTQAGMAGMSGSGVTGGAPATGGTTSGAGGTSGGTPTTAGTGGDTSTTGGTAATTGGTSATSGGNGAGGAETPVEDGGCACSLPGSKSSSPPFAALAAAAVLVLGRARRQRRDLRG
jgi:MYXO-CTERM domain-containing protein